MTAISISQQGRRFFAFPDTVNEVAARSVATVVVVLSCLAILADQKYLLIPLAYGFWARVLSGPKISPAAIFATRVVAPRLPQYAKEVSGAPKRFAQAIGVAFSTSALILWVVLGLKTAGVVVLAGLILAASLEALFGLCLGCKIYGLLVRAGVFSPESCPECADLSIRQSRSQLV